MLWRPRMNAPGSVTIGNALATASSARVAAGPSKRVEHDVACGVDREELLVRALRQPVHAPLRNAGADEACLEFRREQRIAALEEHEHSTRSGIEHAREQRIVVRMNLEQRLRAQEQGRILRQTERCSARGRGRRHRITRADAGQRDEPLGVMRRAVLGLHASARQEHVDGGQAGRYRVPPPGALYRRKAQCRERERHGRHAELRVHENVQCVAANVRRDLRRPPSREVPHVIRARGDACGERVNARHEVIDEHLERFARQIGDPALEIPPGRSVAKESACESDPHRPAARAIGQCRRERPRQAIEQRAIFHLQRAVVLALIGEKEIRPAELVERRVERHSLRTWRATCFPAARVLHRRLHATRSPHRRSPAPSAARGCGRSLHEACGGHGAPPP